jgi:hypothetical protein
VRGLVTDGLVNIGAPARRGGFVAWTDPLPEIMDRIARSYHDSYDDPGRWQFACWLDFTDKAFDLMKDGRDQTLLHWLWDWACLRHLDWHVYEERRIASAAQRQARTLQIIESLAAEGCCEVGELSENVEHFIAWTDALAVALERIREVYVGQHHARGCGGTTASSTSPMGRQYARRVEDEMEQRIS